LNGHHTMIELLDPINIDSFAYDGGHLNRIRQFSLLPNHRIGWNYCMDYSWIAMKCSNIEMKSCMRIIDIGCGPGAIHGYLEDTYGLEIIGIDLHRWEKDYVDIMGDFTDSQSWNKHGFKSNSVDIILSTSAFEHNCPPDHKRLVEICMNSLRPGGHLLATFAVAPATIETPGQWNLSREHAEEFYGERFYCFDYQGCWQRWKEHREIPSGYRERYGKWSADDPPFLSAGAHIVKFF